MGPTKPARTDHVTDTGPLLPESISALKQLREFLEDTLNVRHAALRKLLLSLDSVPDEIADMFEDAANHYLDLADLIRELNPDSSDDPDVVVMLKRARKPRS